MSKDNGKGKGKAEQSKQTAAAADQPKTKRLNKPKPAGRKGKLGRVFGSRETLMLRLRVSTWRKRFETPESIFLPAAVRYGWINKTRMSRAEYSTAIDAYKNGKGGK